MTIETLPKAWEPIRDKMARAMYIDWFKRNEDLPVYDDLPDEDRIYWTEQADAAMLAFVNTALESGKAEHVVKNADGSTISKTRTWTAAELSRLTRDRDEAFNAGIEAAAEKVNGLIVRSNSWRRDAVAAIRALKKPATDEAAGKSGE